MKFMSKQISNNGQTMKLQPQPNPQPTNLSVHTSPGSCLSLQTEAPKQDPLSPSAENPLQSEDTVHFSVTHKNVTTKKIKTCQSFLKN